MKNVTVIASHAVAWLSRKWLILNTTIKELDWISSTLTEFWQRNFVPIVFSSHPEFISGSIPHWRLQSNIDKMLLEFLPRSNSFTYGLSPYRFNILAIWHECRTEIRWNKFSMTGMYSYHSNPEDYFANALNDRQHSYLLNNLFT